MKYEMSLRGYIDYDDEDQKVRAMRLLRALVAQVATTFDVGIDVFLEGERKEMTQE